MGAPARLNLVFAGCLFGVCADENRLSQIDIKRTINAVFRDISP